MALRVEIVDSLGSLLEPLAELLRTPTGALLMPELVAIPGIGVRLWLSEELARRLGTASAASSDGITTNIEFVFIGGLVARALGSREAHDAWQVERLTFWVLQVIANEPQLVPQNRRAEGLLLAALGTALGILAGLYMGYVMVAGISASGIFRMQYTFPLAGVLAATAAGLLFGVLAALVPVRQAARMQIIAALRYE